MQKSKVNNKVNQQSITIFQYYLDQLFPSILKGYSQTVKKAQKLRTQYRSVGYHYLCDTIELSSEVNTEAALIAARNIYFKDLAFKIDDFRGLKQKKTGLKMIPLQGCILDRIDLFLKEDSMKEDQNKAFRAGLSRQSYKATSDIHLFRQKWASPDIRKQDKNKRTKQNLFQLYVIHHCQQNNQSTNLQWLNFIERFKFVEQKNQFGQMATFIIYQAVFTKKLQENILSLDFTELLLKQYFQNNCRISSRGRVLLLEDMEHEFRCLENDRSKNSEEEIQRLSFDPSHRRALQIPGQYKPIMERLKSKTDAYYYKLFPTRECNNYYLENLVCRMMQNKSFKEDASWDAIEAYLDLEKQLRTKYTWDDFLEFREMNLINYCGKDHMGRPVVLFTSRNVRFNKIHDKKKFIIFHNYFFIVYLQQKKEGWVDQFDAIFDTSEQEADNTDLSVTKELITEAYKYYLGQSNHVVICYVNMLVKMVTKFIFPLVPGRVMELVEMLGDDNRQIFNKLREYMPMDTIPLHLGGTNKEVFNNSQDLKLINKSSSMSFERSFVPLN